MGTIKIPDTVILIMGLLYGDDEVGEQTEKILTKKWGPFARVSSVYPFDYTDYYNAELGDSIKRKYCSFERLIKKDTLAKIKRTTNDIEKRYAESGKRRINIDPGYIDLSKLVLASTKDYSHRVHIGGGIYAEVTLSFQKEGFTVLPWTYPDYKSEKTVLFFNTIRNDYHAIMKSRKRN